MYIFGFAFKANTNDTRESPAIKICKGLLEEGCKLNIYDPKVNKGQIESDLGIPELSQNIDDPNIGGWEYSKSIIDSAKNSDAIIVITEWDEFKNIDWKLISKEMRSPAWLFDTRSICDIDNAENNGINVWRIGAG